MQGNGLKSSFLFMILAFSAFPIKRNTSSYFIGHALFCEVRSLP